MREGIAHTILLVTLCCGSAPAIAQTSNTEQLKTSSLEDLTQMNISVSSFARHAEDVAKTPGAVYVITSEQIQRSAATSIPDLLRMVPGVQVAQINASRWAVTARGFNHQYANKLLVLVDGRTVYSEVLSGVNWEEIDIPFSDIDRIEVIRGPGAAVWGTNAVNGVINIITKPVRHSLATEATGYASNLMQRAAIHYGGALTEHSQFSLDLDAVKRRALVDSLGQQQYDGQDSERLSGRIDWQPVLQDSVLLTGQLYRGNVHAELIAPPAAGGGTQDSENFSGGNLLGRWEHQGAPSDTVTQMYVSRQAQYALHNEGTTDTADLDTQDHFQVGARHDIILGAEVRFTVDRTAGTPLYTLKREYNNYLAAVFFQDEIAIVPGKLFATAGVKLQQGKLSGFQAQPSVRLLWSPTSTQSLWLAASRAAVAVSVADIGLDYDAIVDSSNGLPVIAFFTANSAMKPEVVDAYEAGYRIQLPHCLALDVASYHNVDARIPGIQSSAPQFSTEYGPSIAIPETFVNGYRALTEGLEASLTWKPTRSLDLTGSYAWMQAHGSQTLPGFIAIRNSWNSPRNSGSLSASQSLSHGWQVNSFLQYVQALSDTSPTFHGSTPGHGTGAYTRLDMHVTHHLGSHLNLDAGGTNLLSAHHIEFNDDNPGLDHGLEVPRSLYLKARITF